MDNMTTIDAQARQELKSFQQKFEPFFLDYLSQKKLSIDAFTADTLGVHDLISDLSTRQAKRLRASFAYFVYKMCGGIDEQPALQLGMFLELIHTYLLIIDDIMDQGTLRRGQPTAHQHFEQAFPNLNHNNYGRTHAEHFGISIAMNAGVLACHYAYELLADINISDQNKNRILRLSNQNLTKTGYGQIRDITNSILAEISEDEIFETLSLKSGIYTYSNPIAIGALAAGVTQPEHLQQLEQYAIPGGIAFQIQDDIIGMFSETDEMGKSSLDDMREGKFTLLVQHAFAHADTPQTQTLNSILGNPDATQDDLLTIRTLMQTLGSYDYARDKAQELTNQALAALDYLPDSWDTTGIDYLRGISTYIINRNK
jgi:geranylgeranyl pyrophosphate synthase